MTAIAGYWRFDRSSDLRSAVTSMLAAQVAYGPHGSAVAELEEAAFGRALYRLLPEDSFDVQPLVHAESATMLVADIRLDNREELTDSLGLGAARDHSDAGLLLHAYLKWGDETPERILGDFAFAIWNARRKSLLLARDTAGQRPLHYHVGKGFVAFATMPEALHQIPEIPRELDRLNLAAFVADVPRESSATFYRGISRVDPGRMLNFRRDRIDSRSYWSMPNREIRYPKQSDYEEALREQLDRATRSRLRGVGALVGAHLSAGLDSGGVAATAARLMAPAGGRVVAFTSAPRRGFDGPVLPGRIGDESAVAATVAALYPNMEHVVIRPEGMSPLDIVARDSRLFQEPVGHPCNFVWWSRVHDEAQARGLSVMLTGEAGNVTMSAGGLGTLAEFVRTGRLLKWFNEARLVAGTGPSWRGLLATSFGPWLPKFAWRVLSKRFGPAARIDCLTLVHPDLRPALESRASARTQGGQPPADDRRVRWEALQQHEPGNFRKGVLARWGVDERDPTSDRRLAEFCLSVPAEQLFSGGTSRRLARSALADRLPPAVLNAPRGYQYPDWYEGIDQDRIERILAQIEAGPVAASLLDMSQLRQLAESWPSSDWAALHIIGTYRLALLMALSAGGFANKVCQ